MKQALVFLIGLVLIALIILVPGDLTVEAAAAADFKINQYQVAVDLRADGSAQITETISYQMLQRVKQLKYTIDHADAENVRLTKIDVATPTDRSAVPVFIDVLPANAASNQLQPLTYEMKDNGKELQIQLNALSEANSQRIVRLTYELTHCVTRYQNAALLRRRFFASIDAIDIGQPSLTIKLPQMVSALQIWYLPVSLAAFQATQPQNGQIAFQANQMLATQDLTIYCLMPPEIFANTAVAKINRSWDELTAEARTRESELQNQSRLMSALSSFLYILLGLALLIVLLIFLIFDREGAAKFRQKYLLEIPAGCSPALAAILLHKARPGRLILGTLLDLVKRGELSLHGCVFTWLNPGRQDFNGFSAPEIYLLQWLFGHVTTGTILSTAEIRRVARDQATAQEFQTYYQQFRQLLDEEVVSHGLIDTQLTRKGRLFSWLAAAVYLILAIAASIGLHSLVGLHLLIPTVILTVYGLQIRRLTIPGRELYARCQAIKRTIGHYQQLPVPADDQLTRSLLPLAVSLGAADRWLRQMAKAAETAKAHQSALFQEYGLTVSTQSWPNQVCSLAADLNVMESMLSASLLMSSGIHW